MIKSVWASIHRSCGENDFCMDVIGSNVLTFVFFWIVGGLLLITDLTGIPSWALKYKTQPGKNQPIDQKKLLDAIKTGIFNQFMVGIPTTIVVYYIKVSRGFSCSVDDLPSPLTIFAHLVAFVVFEEIGFYYSHRLLHWGPLYKTIHKKHHEWTAPVGIVAIYAHPVEHIFSNIFPLALGPVVMRSHLMTTWIWYVLALYMTIIHHSGYHLPFISSPEFHDFHHLKFNCNYGVMGYLDWLHSTDKQFRNSVHFERHRTIFQLTPASILFPSPSSAS